jgi:hypothetical protein
MEYAAGFAPATFDLASRRSDWLSYAYMAQREGVAPSPAGLESAWPLRPTLHE